MGSANFSFYRTAIYQASPLVQPVVFPWQYRWKTDRFELGGVSRKTILLPADTGQIMSWYLRLFDPLANGGLGAPIPLTDIAKISYVYGSGLNRFTGTPLAWQGKWMRQHGILLPPGVVAWDDALTEQNLITNERLLNTLQTANVQVQLEFTAPLSAEDYAVLGCESLIYVA